MKAIYTKLLFILFVASVSLGQDKSTLDSLLTSVCKTSNSKAIVSNSDAQKIIGFGDGVLSKLADFFTDSSSTVVQSDCQNRFLTKGEVAIILADRIDGMPYYTLTHIQNCTLQFCEDNPNHIEYYFGYMKRKDLSEFKTAYLDWLDDNARKEEKLFRRNKN